MHDDRRSPQLSTIETSQLLGTAGGTTHCPPPPAHHPAPHRFAPPCHPVPVRPVPYRGPAGYLRYPGHGFAGYGYGYPGFGFPGFGGRW
jgi:hypothetical protein